MKKAILPLVLSCLSVTVFAAGAPPFAAWNFDQVNGKTIPAAAGKKSLTLINMKNIKVVPGKKGQAVAFLGKDKERGTIGSSMATNFQWDCSKPFTIETIFKLNADAGYRNFKDILCFSDGELGPGLRVSIFYDRVIFRSGIRKKSTDLATNATKTAIPREKWHFLTLTYDGKTASIYLNGVLAAAKEMTVTPNKYKTLFVGSFRNNYAYALQGAIDDLKIYDYAKSANDVAEAFLKAFDE